MIENVPFADIALVITTSTSLIAVLGPMFLKRSERRTNRLIEVRTKLVEDLEVILLLAREIGQVQGSNSRKLQGAEEKGLPISKAGVSFHEEFDKFISLKILFSARCMAIGLDASEFIASVDEYVASSSKKTRLAKDHSTSVRKAADDIIQKIREIEENAKSNLISKTSSILSQIEKL